MLAILEYFRGPLYYGDHGMHYTTCVSIYPYCKIISRIIRIAAPQQGDIIAEFRNSAVQLAANSIL